MRNQKVAIILLNWNSYRDTADCLNSLDQLTYRDFHVFLVDNDSKDGSFEKLTRDFSDGHLSYPITFIQSGDNLGFAGGNNVGIREAYGQGFQYFWMLNNDTVVDPDALNSLVEIIASDPKIGIVGSKIYYFNTDIIWFAGGKINRWTGNTCHYGAYEKDTGQCNALKEVDYITGCSLLFKRDVIDSIGYMTEDYFLYYEETDWNTRAKNMGWSIIYDPSSIVYHKVSISSGGEKNLAPYVDYYYIRNSYMYIMRTQPLTKRIFATMYNLLKALKIVLRILLKNNRKLERLWYLNKAISHTLTGKMGRHPNYSKH